MKRRPRLAALGVAVLVALAAPAAADLDLRQVCDAYTPLTLIGVDTEAAVALFAMPSRQERIPGWLVELDMAAAEARLYPDWRERRRFGGSIAPGPVLVLGRCGDGCLQLLAWDGGTWREVGGPLAAAAGAGAHPTRDRDGTPWVVLHRPTDEAGVVVAEAWRLEGGDWRAHGRLLVAAVGSPAARPAADAGVLSGSGHFTPEGPEQWIAGLPGLPAGERGQLVPGEGNEVAYLARDGRLYLSTDGGGAWRANRWWPWGNPPAAGAEGPRWSLDLPAGAAGPPLAVAWFDHRDPQRSLLYLGERSAGSWRLVARLPASEPLAGAEIGYSHLLRRADGRWLLIAGCEVTDRGCALRARTVDPDGATRVPSLLLRPTWLDRR